MKRATLSLIQCTLGLICGGPSLAQNAPEPPLPQRSGAISREAAAAIQVPRSFAPPPIPQQGQPAQEKTLPAPSAATSPIPAQSVAPGASAAVAPVPLASGRVSIGGKVTTSTSTSGQFVVHGNELQVRSFFSSHCEEAARKLRHLLRDDEPWVLPVVISVKMPPEVNLSGPAVSTGISQIANGGFHLQVTIQARPDFRLADLDAEMIRILLAERILRNKNGITTKRSRILPDWLLTGVTQALTFRDRARPSAVFSAIFRSGKIYGIDEILSVSPGELDALSRTIYETSCCALVLALLDQPEGAMRLRQFLGKLAIDSREDRELLDACFPGIATSGSSLNKWWSIQMASLATPGVFETLGPTQTKTELEAALAIRYEIQSTEAMPKRSAPVIAEEEPPANAEESVEKKLGLISRIFSGKSSNADKSEEKPTETKPKAEEPPPEEPAATNAKRTGLLNRMFGSKDAPAEEAPKEESKETPAKKPKAEPKPAPEEKPKTEEEPAPKKPGLFKRVFGSGGEAKKEEPEKKPEPEPKKSGAALTTDDWSRLLASAQVFASDMLARLPGLLVSSSIIPTGREVVLGFGKKKKAAEAAAAEEKKEEPKPAPPSKPIKARPVSARPDMSESKPKAASTRTRTVTVPVAIPVEDYTNVMKRKDRAAIFERNIKTLTALMPRAHVLFRPAINDFIVVFRELQEGKSKDADARITALRSSVKKAFEQAKAVEDHLDWFEASETKSYSGAFDDYLRLPKIIEKELPARTDPLSRHLDALDAEFAK